MKLTEKKENNVSRVLIFGGPKTGKTLLAGRLAEKFKILYFDLENGYETLLQLPKEQQERIEIISIPDTRVFPIAIETMLKVVKGARVEICETHGKVACMLCRPKNEPFTAVDLSTLTSDTVVVIDSLTQLTNSGIAFISKSQPDDYKPSWEDWARLGILMDTFLSQIQQASYNLVCISHEVEAEKEDGKNKLFPVAGTRNFSRNVAKYFDHVVYADVKMGKHVFASSSTYAGTVQTGSRTGVVLEKEINPSLLSIFVKDTKAVEPVEPVAITNLKNLLKK